MPNVREHFAAVRHFLMEFQATREQIIETAKSFAGVAFLHQGRSTVGTDCVGLLVLVGRSLNYPDVRDITDYRRVPKAEDIKATLALNCDEIPLSDILPGDIYLMRMQSRKARHAAIYLGNEWHGEPALIHAVMPVVKIQPLSDFDKSWFVSAFRMRGILE